MKRILYIERKSSEGVSIEKVFRRIAEYISKNKFEIAFEQLPYLHDTISTLKNLLFYKASEADIYHVTGHVHYITLILPSEKTVLTVHDLRILEIRKGLRRYVLKKLLYDFPVKKLKYITAISEKTRREFVELTKCDADKIRVIENPLTIAIEHNEKKEFNAYCPNILQIGTTDNKNLFKTISALSRINCRLTIIGKIDQTTLEHLNNSKINFVNKRNLNNEEIRNEYRQADIVTFCSTYEGFGLPIIEAQAMRTPVITSDLSPMKEVSGDGAILVDPDDIESIRLGFRKIINEESLRKSLVERGLENIKRFENIVISRQYEDLYTEILQSNR